ncbi:MAG: methyl-accepting chemotaxis protein [Bacillales bacterium]|jgi:methyl-accepting chemotaxis protein|nr:methyl-accepting chemotaxis protein [Bacillales bacterium]
MKNFKIKTKIIICAAALFLVTIIMAINSMVSINHILVVQQAVKDFYVSERSSIQEITVVFNKVRISTRDMYLSAPLPEDREARIDQLGDLVESLGDKVMGFIGNRIENRDLLRDKNDVEREEFEDSLSLYIGGMNTVIETLIDKPETTFEELYADHYAIAERADAAIASIFEIDKQQMDIINAENNEYNTNIMFINILLISIELIFCVVITLVLSSSIAGPIKELVIASKKIASGNTPEIKMESSNDEIGELVNAFKQMTEYINYQVEIMESISEGNLVIKPSLRGESDKLGIALTKMINSLNVLLYDVSMTASQLAISSRTIADGSINLAQGSTEQASSVEELYTTIERIASRTRDNAELSRNANHLVSVIDNNTKNGVEKMIELVDAVKEIIDSTKDIKNIINFIDNIAFQTNILSLNATIEASNAGEHGKIFTVIADEVHKLASQCAESARKTEKIIALTLEKSGHGSKLADDTRDSLVNIAEEIQHAKRIIGDIAKASDEQAVAISQINIGIEQVSQVVNYNSHTAEESAKSSEQLALQSARLKSNVSKFQIK